MRKVLLLLLVMLAALAAQGCGDDRAVDAQAQQAAALEAQAARELDMYRQLLASDSFELAAPIGTELVARFPDSEAAREVLLTLEDTRERGSAAAHSRRLQRLWTYQSGEQSGAAQHTASIYSSQPQAADKRVRLILRRHGDWGQSAYFFGAADGFRCSAPCRVEIEFDGQSRRVPAHLPPTGEPALLVDDAQQFIGWLEETQLLRAHLPGSDGAMQIVEFETGGFEPARYRDVPLGGAAGG